MQKGYTMTRQGFELIAQALATSTPVEWTGVIVGEGAPPDGTDLADVEQLVAPVAAGTSTVPEYKRDRVSMTIEYRSDLNGGIGRDVNIREFGVFAKLGTEAESEPVLMVYGSMGDYPAYVGMYTENSRDIRRWPIVIKVGAGVTFDLGYSPQAFMTAEDIQSYCTTYLLPDLTAKLWELIRAHNADPDAHAGTLRELQSIRGDLDRLLLQMGTGITSNAFSVTFGSLEGIEAEGVWNKDKAQIQFGTVSSGEVR